MAAHVTASGYFILLLANRNLRISITIVSKSYKLSFIVSKRLKFILITVDCKTYLRWEKVLFEELLVLSKPRHETGS